MQLFGKTGNLSFSVTNAVNGTVYLTNVLDSPTVWGGDLYQHRPVQQQHRRLHADKHRRRTITAATRRLMSMSPTTTPSPISAR